MILAIAFESLPRVVHKESIVQITFDNQTKLIEFTSGGNVINNVW